MLPGTPRARLPDATNVPNDFIALVTHSSGWDDGKRDGADVDWRPRAVAGNRAHRLLRPRRRGAWQL